MFGLLSRQLANVRQKRKIFLFSVGNAVVQKKRLYTVTLAHLPKKMDLRLATIRKESCKTRIVFEMLLSSLKSFFGKIYQKDVHSHWKSIKTILKYFNYFLYSFKLSSFFIKAKLIIYFYSILLIFMKKKK